MFDKRVSFHEPIKNIIQVKYNKDINFKIEKNGWRLLSNFFHIFSPIENSPSMEFLHPASLKNNIE